MSAVGHYLAELDKNDNDNYSLRVISETLGKGLRVHYNGLTIHTRTILRSGQAPQA